MHNKCKYEYELRFELFDDAKEFTMDVLGDNYTIGPNGMLISDDRIVTVRFDTDLSITHVQQQGPHINLQIWGQPFGTKGGPNMNIHLLWRK